MFKGAHRSAGVVERMVSAAGGNGELSRRAASSNVLPGSSHGELLVVVMEKPRLRRLRWFWCGLGKGWRASGLEGGNSFSPFHNYSYWNVTLWSVVAPYGTTHASFMVGFPPPIGRWEFTSLHYSVLFLAKENFPQPTGRWWEISGLHKFLCKLCILRCAWNRRIILSFLKSIKGSQTFPQLVAEANAGDYSWKCHKWYVLQIHK